MLDIHAADHYARLGVPRTATAEEIRRAYRSLVRRYPPERAPEEFKRIQEAYDTLRDPHTRHEYDTQPDPVVAGWLRLASAAMQEQEYSVAERYLKEVLEHAPNLTFVRNLLGLALLYQGRAAEAITQYEQLLRDSDDSPVWHGNAGQAYRLAGRFQEAERAFRRAILSGEEVTPYFLGLVDLYLDQKDYNRAAATLEKAIRHDGRIDFEDLKYFTKLIEVHVRAGSREEMESVLQRLKGLAPRMDGSQRELAALTLGDLARQLLIALVPAPARAIASAAREFQPGDNDYITLERLASYLARGDWRAAVGLVVMEPVLQEDGWLADAGAAVIEFDRRRLNQGRGAAGLRPEELADLLRSTPSGNRRVTEPDGSLGRWFLGYVILFVILVLIGSLCSNSQPGGAILSTATPRPPDVASPTAPSPPSGTSARTALKAGIDREIDAVEGRYPAGIPSVQYPSYVRSVEQHNDLVREQQELVARHRRRLAEYRAAVAAFNERVADYNARRY